MIKLEPFTQQDFKRMIAWIDSNETLITIAGHYFSFPLTEDQLERYLNDANSYSFNVIDIEENHVIGHAEIIRSGDNNFKVDKLIIDPSGRGKGVGQQVMNELVNYAFTQLQATTIELYVFEQNKAAIRCYEKTGFVIGTNSIGSFLVGDKYWNAFSMIINKGDWLTRNL